MFRGIVCRAFRLLCCVGQNIKFITNMNVFLVAIAIITLIDVNDIGVHGSKLKDESAGQISKRHSRYFRRRASGTVYTRWGHVACPQASAQLVYSGWVGGSHFTHQGAAAEYICLSQKRTQSTDTRKYSHFGYLYGAEYEFTSRYNFDVPCAVCQSYARRNSFMLPGSDICPHGWSLEYKGDLMSGYYGHAASSQYVCVDSARKSLHGGFQDSNGKLLYPVTAQCGSLRCPPYVSNKLVTCAVCSK